MIIRNTELALGRWHKDSRYVVRGYEHTIPFYKFYLT
jgi:hypothetical protein